MGQALQAWQNMNALTAPIPDDKMIRIMEQLNLETKHLALLWKRFKQYDKDKSGTIDVEEFYRMIHEERNIFADSIFDLIDADKSGVLEFSEFVQAIGTYCVFGTEDILKFCFYIFDKDKNGFIEMDELHALADILHGAEKSSNLKVALEKVDANGDGKIDFGEFKQAHKEFPALLYPAFRVQESMMEFTLGATFWRERRAELEESRVKKRGESEEFRKKEEARTLRRRRGLVKQKMGFFNYYLCWNQRKAVFDSLGEDDKKKRVKDARKKARKKRAENAKVVEVAAAPK